MISSSRPLYLVYGFQAVRVVLGPLGPSSTVALCFVFFGFAFAGQNTEAPVEAASR